jgi:hypothetical protein
MRRDHRKRVLAQAEPEQQGFGSKQQPRVIPDDRLQAIPLRFNRFAAVRDRTGLSRSTIWRLERQGAFHRQRTRRLEVIGFAIRERRSGSHSVTFPARQYAVNGERRSFALLCPITDVNAQNRVR